MKRSITSLMIVLCSMIVMAQEQVPAFPGAEGHGRYVKGGRDGEVRHVTNLKDSGTGSFRAAVSGGAKKIIVFDVSGVIALSSNLSIGDNTTIAGQTAPYPGITLRYYTIRPGANNIIRFIRFRRGQERDVDDGADATWQREKKNIILDHCSFSWSIDEIASFYDNRDFTMQWCTLGEALANPGHSKGEHSYGGIWGGKGASFHHNFLCHMQNRSPRFCGARYGESYATYDKTKYANPIQAEIVDFRNCVMYNWGNGNGCYGGTGGGQINMVNNYYKAGPGTRNKTRVTQVSVATSSNASGSPYMGYASRYYIHGNYVTAANNPENYDWQGVIYDNGLTTIDGEKCIPDEKHLYGENVTYYQSGGKDYVRVKMDAPVETGMVTTHTAKNAYQKVLKYGGASLYRDQVDARYMKEAEGGTTTFMGAIAKTAGIIDKVEDQGTYELESVSRPADFDTDNDGIADIWETANGLNPNDAGDAALYTLDSDKKWYTNLEVYMNSLVEDIMKDGNANAETPVDEYYPTYTYVEIPSGKTSSDDDQPEPSEGTVAQITWAFDSGNKEEASFSDNTATCFVNNDITLGSNLEYNGTANLDNVKETKIRALVPNEEAPNDGNALRFIIQTKEGYSFKASKVSFVASRMGTDGGKFDATWVDAGGETLLTTGETPNRNNGDPKYSSYSFNISNAKATEGECSLVIHIYALGQLKDDGSKNMKDYGFGNIQITGELINNENTAVEMVLDVQGASRTYYNIGGQKMAKPRKGINIEVIKQTDGTVRNRKIIIR